MPPKVNWSVLIYHRMQFEFIFTILVAAKLRDYWCLTWQLPAKSPHLVTVWVITALHVFVLVILLLLSHSAVWCWRGNVEWHCGPHWGISNHFIVLYFPLCQCRWKWLEHLWKISFTSLILNCVTKIENCDPVIQLLSVSSPDISLSF